MKIRDLLRPEAIELSAPAGNLKDAAAYQAAGTFSRLIVMLMDPDFCSKLRNVSDPEEFLQIIDRQEAEKYPDEQQEAEQETVEDTIEKKGYRILAVLCCR